MTVVRVGQLNNVELKEGTITMIVVSAAPSKLPDGEMTNVVVKNVVACMSLVVKECGVCVRGGGDLAIGGSCAPTNSAVSNPAGSKGFCSVLSARQNRP